MTAAEQIKLLREALLAAKKHAVFGYSHTEKKVDEALSATEEPGEMVVVLRIVERLRTGLQPAGEFRSKVAKAAGIGFDTGILAALAVIEEECGGPIERQPALLTEEEKREAVCLAAQAMADGKNPGDGVTLLEMYANSVLTALLEHFDLRRKADV